MVTSISKMASPAQVVGYFEKDGYYAKDDGAHREASAWAGKAAAALVGLEGRSIRKRSVAFSKARFRAGGVSGGRSSTAASRTVRART